MPASNDAPPLLIVLPFYFQRHEAKQIQADLDAKRSVLILPVGAKIYHGAADRWELLHSVDGVARG